MGAVARRILSIHRSDEEIRATKAGIASIRFDDGKPYSPYKVAGRKNNEPCLAMDRPMDGGGTTSLQQYYPTKLQLFFFKNNKVLMAIVSWEGYGDDSNAYQMVRWSDISFENELGRGKRKRKTTDAYSPEPEKRVRKKKPRTRRKGGGNMQEVIDLLDGDDDDRSQV